jgi:hypothetical protein
VVSIVAVVVFLVLLGGGALGLTVLIRYAGKERQVMYDADVAQSIASSQPDAAFDQRQAEIEQNLADADALAAQVEESTPVTPPVSAPPAPDSGQAPDPTI